MLNSKPLRKKEKKHNKILPDHIAHANNIIARKWIKIIWLWNEAKRRKSILSKHLLGGKCVFTTLFHLFSLRLFHFASCFVYLIQLIHLPLSISNLSPHSWFNFIHSMNSNSWWWIKNHHRHIHINHTYARSEKKQPKATTTTSLYIWWVSYCSRNVYNIQIDTQTIHNTLSMFVGSSA